jgi:hypothetical protein
MERRILVGFVILGVAASACTLGPERESPVPLPTSLPTQPVIPASRTPQDTPFPALDTFTGPYASAAALLDGVCFEFLSTMNGETWAWTSTGELAAFYDRVDASALCPSPVRRGTFDFGPQVLAGAVNTAVGCDAAHRVLSLTQDDAAQMVTVILQFALLPGCNYELVQPLLIAMPRPPAGYALRVILAAP